MAPPGVRVVRHLLRRLVDWPRSARGCAVAIFPLGSDATLRRSSPFLPGAAGEVTERDGGRGGGGGQTPAGQSGQTVHVPELPEVEALAAFLRERLIGRAVDRVDIGTINVLKTYDPAPAALRGLTVT